MDLEELINKGRATLTIDEDELFASNEDEVKKHDIIKFNIVVINLYPFDKV